MNQPTPPRISLTAATAIVVASMVGTGVFTSLGYQIGGLPSGFPILMLWTVGGVIALCGALSYAELTAMMPRSGGEYHLVGRAYHPLVGFLAGWVSITAGFSAPIALAAIAFGKYARGVWPGLANPVLHWLKTHLPASIADSLPDSVLNLDARLVAFGVVAFLTVLQLGGVRFIAKFHVSLTVLRVLLIIAFVAGAFYIGTHPLDFQILAPKPGDTKYIFGEVFQGSFSDVMGRFLHEPRLLLHVLNDSFALSLFYVMYAYSGWNGAVYVAGEMNRPQRNLPLALLLGTVIVMVLYIALNAIFLMGGDWSAMRNQEDVGLIAARGIFSEQGSLWMGSLIAFGLLSTVNAMLWTGATTLRVIGRDMRALCWLDASDRRGEPVSAVLFMTNLVLILLGTGSFQSLLDYTQALLQLSAVLVVIAVIWMRIRAPKMARPFRVPLFPIPPLIFIAASIWMLCVMMNTPEKREQVAWGAATLGIGVLLYLCSPKNKFEDEATPGTTPEAPPAPEPAPSPAFVATPEASPPPPPPVSEVPPPVMLETSPPPPPEPMPVPELPVHPTAPFAPVVEPAPASHAAPPAPDAPPPPPPVPAVPAELAPPPPPES